MDIEKATNLLEKYWVKSKANIKKILQKKQVTQLLFDEEDIERTLRLIKTIKPHEEIRVINTLSRI